MKRWVPLIVIFFFTLAVAGTTSLAATTESNGDINLRYNTGIKRPIEPTQPEKKLGITATDPGVNPATPGPLSIDYISNIHFGAQKITGNDVVYYALTDKVRIDALNKIKEVPNFIEITDDRGSNSGWKLSVTQNGPLKNGDSSLNGATLKLNNAKLGTINLSMLHTYAPIAKSIVLDSTGTNASELIYAAGNKGMGTWINLFGTSLATAKKSIALEVPGSIPKKEGLYKTTLTWTLTDSPD
ncbi:WxL domain-containing protein [Listeria rustica]|uniref:WxL domain-containing protein n=1 Tax=Listeria rustica TaxID=2713503 RepID=A0A7W1T938_9LIST|nr:WxL domain-containing protein [Listeria rustica]MBA3927713.1 WxL domain-containing protein [Listeria rustica]